MSDDLDILERLIGFETLNSASNLHMIDFCQDLLTTCGFRVKRLRDPIEAKAGLFAEIGPAGPGGILLSAHSDVVPVAGQAWTRPPFRLTRDGAWLYGRGTTDMKGFLAQMLALAQKARGAQLTAPLKLLISYDEEIGCVGLARMRARLADLVGQPRLAIVGEPTEMQVGLAHKGKRAYLARVPGQAGHSAAAPNIVNALQVGVDFVTALRALQEDLRQTGARDPAFDVPYTTIHVGTFHSGSALNVVPERAELRFEFRHLAADDPDALEGRIRQAAHKATPPQLSPEQIVIETQAAYPGLSQPLSHDAVRQVQAWAGTQTCALGFGTEAGLLADMGIPSVVCGPGSMEKHGHKPDECISMSQMTACSKMLDAVLTSLR